MDCFGTIWLLVHYLTGTGSTCS